MHLTVWLILVCSLQRSMVVFGCDIGWPSTAHPTDNYSHPWSVHLLHLTEYSTCCASWLIWRSHYEALGTRDRVRPRKTWSTCVRNDMTICNLDGVNPLDRNSWGTSVRRARSLPRSPGQPQHQLHHKYQNRIWWWWWFMVCRGIHLVAHAFVTFVKGAFEMSVVKMPVVIIIIGDWCVVRLFQITTTPSVFSDFYQTWHKCLYTNLQK